MRTYRLGDQSLWIDEGYTINAAEAIQTHGYPLLGSGEAYWDMPLATYTSAGAMAILGFNPFSPSSARVPAAIFGVALIAMIYLLGQSLFKNRLLALLPAFLVTFSTWEIAWARQARGYAPLSFFILLTLWFLWRYFEKGKWQELCWAALAFVGAYLSHTIALVLLPALLFLFVVRWASGAGALEHMTRNRFFAYGGAVLCVSVLFFMFAPRFTPLETYGLNAGFISFLFGTLGLFSFGAIAGGLLGLFDAKRFWAVLTLFVPAAFSALIIVGYSPLVQFRYLFMLFPLMLMLASYLVFRISELLLPRFPRIATLPYASALLTGIIVILVSLPYLSFLPTAHYNLEFGSPQPDFKGAYALVQEMKKPGDIIISPYAQLTNIYLGEKGLWLPISLTGRTSDLDASLALGVDYYTGAPLIENQDRLVQMMDSQSGFVILDAMATARLRKQSGQAQLIDSKINEVYHSGSGFNELWVYAF